jgi:predicted hydrolase (HD superfamily)
MRTAIMGHASYTGIKRESLLAKTLFAVDELSGFIIAVALVRPSKSIFEVEPRSVQKKFKDKAFAAKVNREEIKQGITELGVDETEHIQNVIDALKSVAAELGLAGS